MRGAFAGLMLTLVPSTAWAQAVDAGVDLEAAQAEVDADYAQAMASDCALACKALGSMTRATQRLCAIDPGDRCANARQKLQAASAHVHASCPDCPEELELRPQEGKAAPAPPATVEISAAQESVSKRGGCAGCSTTPTGADGVLPLVLALLAWMGIRRRPRS